jgi:hypothetical protein
MTLTDDEVAERAQRWARFHSNAKYRSKMDSVLADLNDDDERRVRLCGQRMANGLPLKIIPSATRKETKNESSDKTKKRRTPAAGRSTPSAESKVSVGTDSGDAKSRRGRKSSGGQK